MKLLAAPATATQHNAPALPAKGFEMTVEDGEKCWSLDEEQFNYESLEEAIQAIYDLHGDVEPGHVISFGTAHKPDAGDFVDADRVIDDMGDAASDVGGEFAEDFPCVSPEARKELNDILEAWARKHCEVSFYTVDNVQQYTITQADIDAAGCKEPNACREGAHGASHTGGCVDRRNPHEL